MNTITNIHETILSKIKSGAIKQRPKWHFILSALLFMLGFIALSLVFFYLISFVALVFHEHLIFEALSFGPRTMFAMMHTIPFLLILIVAVIFFLLNILVRHFAFAYMKPVAVTLGIGLLLTFGAFALILNTDRQFRIAHFGEDRHVPAIDFLHTTFRDRISRAIVHGTIEGIQGNAYTLQSENGGTTTTVLFTPDTRTGNPSYSVGDFVGVLVEKREGMLYVIGIHKDTKGEKGPDILEP